MNKKDIAGIKKEFKDDSTMVRIKEIYNVFAKKETGEIFHAESQYFEMLEQFQQDLYLANFKKVLTGQLDSKLFELGFAKGKQNSTQGVLQDALDVNTEVWKSQMDTLVAKFFDEQKYNKDVVFTFIRAEYRKPTGKKKEEYEEGKDDETYAHHFILCSVNNTAQPKQAVMFDYVEREFKSNIVTDVIVNLNTPLEGFLYPAFNNNYTDMNHILYSSGKKDNPNLHFIENVLDCTYTTTAKEEKFNFELILKGIIGEKVEPVVLSTIYEEINKVVEENEDESHEPVLDAFDLHHILKTSGLEFESEEELKETVKTAFKDVLDDEKHQFKASSLIPNFTSKSVKIKTKVADVSVKPSDLKGIKQIINHNGKRCILIEVDEDVELEGFTLETERI